MRKRTQNPLEAPITQKILLTVPQAAVVLGVGKDMVYDFIKHHGLPAISLGKSGLRPKLRISVTSLESWVAMREQQQNPYNDLLMTGQKVESRSKPSEKGKKGNVALESDQQMPYSRKASKISSQCDAS